VVDIAALVVVVDQVVPMELGPPTVALALLVAVVSSVVTIVSVVGGASIVVDTSVVVVWVGPTGIMPVRNPMIATIRLATPTMPDITAHRWLLFSRASLSM